MVHARDDFNLRCQYGLEKPATTQSRRLYCSSGSLDLVAQKAIVGNARLQIKLNTTVADSLVGPLLHSSSPNEHYLSAATFEPRTFTIAVGNGNFAPKPWIGHAGDSNSDISYVYSLIDLSTRRKKFSRRQASHLSRVSSLPRWTCLLRSHCRRRRKNKGYK